LEFLPKKSDIKEIELHLKMDIIPTTTGFLKGFRSPKQMGILVLPQADPYSLAMFKEKFSLPLLHVGGQNLWS
jgi:hypothetical protein